MEPSRKRRKTVTATVKPSKAVTYPPSTSVAKGLAQGGGLASVQSEQANTTPCSTHYVPFPPPGHLNSSFSGAVCNHGSLLHVVPQSTTYCTGQPLFIMPSWRSPSRFVEESQPINTGIAERTERHRQFDTSSDIQLLPRAHIRSRSEASGSGSTVQLERMAPKLSISSTVASADQNKSLSKSPLSATTSGWNTNQSQASYKEFAVDNPSERGSLLSYSRLPAQQQNTVDARRESTANEQSVSEEIHENFHIKKHKFLWCVAISIFVGIFLCLFLYAFHIVK